MSPSPHTGPNGKHLAYVLDDEAKVAALVCNVLRNLGYAATPFSDPTALYVEARKAPPRLLVLDLALGQSDAVEVIRCLEVMKFAGQVLLISGRDKTVLAEIERIGTGHGLAMLPSLQKPFRVNDLKERLAAVKAPAAPSAAKDTPKAAAAREFVIDLEKAIKEGWLDLWYQPKIDLNTLSVCGAEALLRARHPEFGIVTPANLLPTAGDPLHYLLAQFVLRRSMADWTRFAERGIALRLALNMPVSVVGTSEFIPLMRRFLPDVPSFPGLIIEVTEDEVIRDAVLIRETAAQLKLYNASIAIDDFGAGHSSLARLIDLPCSEIKLDRSFVIDCATEAPKRAVCESVIALAHRFGAVVCAEGLERPGDLRCLIEMGCDIAQGYLFAKPMPPDLFLNSMAAPRLQDAAAAVPLARARQP